MKKYIFIGSCNYPLLGHGNDFKTPSRYIYCYRIDDNGNLHPWPSKENTFDTGAHNPAFICATKDGSRIYSVDETNLHEGWSGAVLSFTVDPREGRILRKTSIVSSHGSCPCHCSLHHSERWLFVANYMGGSVTSIPLLADGTLSTAVDDKHHPLPVDPALADRQESSHPHMIIEHPVYKDNVLVTDLGHDCLWIYYFDSKNGGLRGTLRDPRHFLFERGLGPRHLAFHPKNPDTCYVLHELGGKISVLQFKTVRNENDVRIIGVEEVQKISSLKSGVTCSRGSHFGCSDIQVSADGLFLYSLNRTDHTISMLSIDPVNFQLSLIGHVPTLGKISRNFQIIPGSKNDWVIVVNQESKTIVVYNRNKATGLLTDPRTTITTMWPTSIAAL